LNGIAKKDFSNNVSDVFKNTVAQTLNVEQEAVIITNVTEGTEGLSKRLLREYPSNERHLRLTTPVLLVDYEVRVVTVKSFHSQNASETAKFLIKSMEESISSGNFSKILISESKNIGVMLNVTTNSLEVKSVKWNFNTATPSVLPSVAPTFRASVSERKSDGTTTLLVVIGSIFGLIGLFCLTYYFYRKTS